MPTDVAASDLFDLIQRSGLLRPETLAAHRAAAESGDPPPNAEMLLRRLVQERWLTPFQAKHLLLGRHKGFFLGDKYKLLAHLGSGGMGQVYLCEQLLLHRLVAVKLLSPTAQPDSTGATERFFREARAAAQLDHPNIVRIFDIDRNDANPYMVMEFVDGTNLHALVAEKGPVNVERALNFTLQAARGLQHAHEAGLVHRDIKPGNLLLDRNGTVKLLDLGLARFQADAKNNNLTARYDDKNILGTADFIAPEQTIDSSKVDIRADIYSLGGTLYYLLTGRAPFEGASLLQKLLWHQIRDPDSASSFRADIPKDVLALLSRMMAKKPEDRFQTPRDIIAALAPWEGANVLPPKPEEMPKFNSNSYRLGLTAGPADGTVETPAFKDTTPQPDSRRKSGIPKPPASDILRTPQSMGEETKPNLSPRQPIPSPKSMPVSVPIKQLPPEPGPTGAHCAKRKAINRRLLIAGGAFALLLLTTAAIWYATLPASNSKPITLSTATMPSTDPGDVAPPLPGVAIDAGGSTFVEKMIGRWSGEYAKAGGGVIRYEGVGSGKGVQGMLARKYAFGCTDASMTDDELAAARKNGSEIVHIPLVMGAVVPTYNLPELKAPIRFTGAVLADIYLGKITRWNHQAIRISNPDLDLPDRPIAVVYRKDKSGTTFIWTDYLWKISAAWRDAMGAPSTEYAKWPVGTAAAKNDGVAESVTQTIGAIGYVELAFAREKNLPVGLVQNSARKDIDPSLESVTAAAASLKSVPFDLRYTLTDAPGENSYPIAGSSWAVFDLKHPDAATRTAVVEFLWWATHDGQKLAPKLLYSPLPAELIGLIEAKLRPLRKSP